jgi:hypothetical protein
MHGSLITESKNSEVHTLTMIRKDTKTDQDSNFFYTLFTPRRFTQIYDGFQEIEKSYYLATELLPGICVAFNHLGIISQQKEQQFLSLYYYSRRLFASSEPSPCLRTTCSICLQKIASQIQVFIVLPSKLKR